MELSVKNETLKNRLGSHHEEELEKSKANLIRGRKETDVEESSHKYDKREKTAS